MTCFYMQTIQAIHMHKQQHTMKVVGIGTGNGWNLPFHGILVGASQAIPTHSLATSMATDLDDLTNSS